MLEDQTLPELMNALSQDLIQGDPKAPQEFQQAMDNYNKTAQQLGNILKELDDSLNAILNVLKQ